MDRANRSSNGRRPSRVSGQTHRLGGGALALLACAALIQWVAGCAGGIQGPEGPLRAPELGRVTGTDGGIEISLKARAKADSYTVYWSTASTLKRGTGASRR